MKTYSVIPNLASMVDEVIGHEIMDRSVTRLFSPKTNIIETENHFELQLLVPGFKKEELTLAIEDKKLTIEGKSASFEKKGMKQKEFSIHPFKRSFVLPANIRLEATEANYVDGILYVKLVKKEEEKNTLQIPVK